MFERFTDRARRVVVLAQEESRLLAHEHIGTEHILLGLVAEGQGVAARALGALGLTLESLRTAVAAATTRGPGAPDGHIPFTPRAKKALELSLREALQLGHNYIGTEHILLGIVREGEGMAMRLLSDLEVDKAKVRHKVIELMAGQQQEMEGDQPPEFGQPTCPGCRMSLGGALGTKSLAATSDDGDGVVAVTIVYCRHCGRALGMLPGASPPI